MKALTKRRAFIGQAITLGLIALHSTPNAADMRGPVCTPVRDVSSVFGQDSSPKVAPHCLVERKVSVPQRGLDVSTILGNGSPAPRTPSHTDTWVNARGKSGHTVEHVMGRAGGGESRQPAFISDSMASPDTGR